MNTRSTHIAMDRLARLAAQLAGASLAALAVVCAWQVFARYVLNDAPGWTEPVALVLLSAVMMLGSACAVRSDSHFGFLVAVDAASPTMQQVLRAISRIIVALTGGALAVAGVFMCVDQWPVAMAGAPLSQGISYLPLAIGGALIAVFSIERLLVPLPQREH